MAEMTPQEIVKTEVERSMPGGTDWKQVYANLHNLVKDPKHRIFRANNSLFIINNNGDHTADIAMATADNAHELAQSIKEFFMSMRKCGFTEVTFAIGRPAMYRVIERAGYKAQILPGVANQGSKAKVTL